MTVIELKTCSAMLRRKATWGGPPVSRYYRQYVPQYFHVFSVESACQTDLEVLLSMYGIYS